MGLVNKVTCNFQEWHCQQLDDRTNMYSRRFSGKIHKSLKDTFKSAYNLFSQDNQTIVISCFVGYTNISILTEN